MVNVRLIGWNMGPNSQKQLLFRLTSKIFLGSHREEKWEKNADPSLVADFEGK